MVVVCDYCGIDIEMQGNLVQTVQIFGLRTINIREHRRKLVCDTCRHKHTRNWTVLMSWGHEDDTISGKFIQTFIRRQIEEKKGEFRSGY
jgi:hypothetical protein